MAVVVVPSEQPLQAPTVELVGSTDWLVATRIRYPALPLTEVHEKVGGSVTPDAPLAGTESVGAERVDPPAVKLKMVDHAAVPLLDVGSMACTCQ